MRLLGILAMIAGGAAFVWSAPRLDKVKQPLGTLREQLDPAYADQVATWQTLYYGGLVALGVGAVLFLGSMVRRRRR